MNLAYYEFCCKNEVNKTRFCEINSLTSWEEIYSINISSSPRSSHLVTMSEGMDFTQFRFLLKLLSIRLSAYLLTGHFKPFYELTSFALLITGSFWLNPPMEITNTIGYPVTDPEINSEKFTSKSFPTYDFIGIPAEGCELEFDVIVISSGAGGGFVAAELAKAGNSVLKGKYYHQSEQIRREAIALMPFLQNARDSVAKFILD
ncbi:148_t:CDS:2 [Funneliformis mosseae]|uniref:148_t:CDS:1 n=1 Tax=Funneliformis mosseae TaxID=27381 RepID=A0A9N8YRV2_FUNMO|nr:148_t:CDS:2 [Funneliformis mosseae]